MNYLETLDSSIQTYTINNVDVKKYNEHRLCYVDTIPETYSDYDEVTKAIHNTPEYQKFAKERKEYSEMLLKTKSCYSSREIDEFERDNAPDIRFTRVNFKEYPNPEYTDGYTHELYFTDDLNKQWGDDWNDAPYEYNSGYPYNDETDVIRVVVSLPEDIILPHTRFWNSPFSVEDINAGAIPWIFWKHPKTILHSMSINGGDSLLEVLDKYRLYSCNMEYDN